MTTSLQHPDGTWHQIGGPPLLLTRGHDDSTEGETVVTTAVSFEIHAQFTYALDSYERASRLIRALVAERRQRLSRMHAQYRRKKRGHR